MINGIAIGLSVLAGVWLGWYAVPLCLAASILLTIIESNPRSLLFLVCLLFAVLGALRSTEPATDTSNLLLAPSTGAVGEIVSFPRPTANGSSALLRVSEICAGEQCVASDGVVLVSLPTLDPPIARGQKIRAEWQVRTLTELQSGYRSYVAATGAEATARVTSARIEHQAPRISQWIARTNADVAQKLQHLLPGDTGALATGIVTGDDTGLSEMTQNNFTATNTSHLTAVSGQNVSLIIGFLSLWYSPRTSWGRLIFHGFLIAAVWSFTVFVGLEAPALRAAIVATLTVLGSHVGRRTDPVTILSLTLGTMALINPLVVHSTGFWLSATAAMALCLTLPRNFQRGPRRAVFAVLLAPAAASIATMPIALSAFGSWSPIGILANILVAPVMTVAFPVTYGYTLLAQAFPGIAEALSWVPGIPLEWALVVINRLAPVATQIRIDSLSPLLILLVWTPILLGIWLISDESSRWIRRLLMRFGSSRD